MKGARVLFGLVSLLMVVSLAMPAWHVVVEAAPPEFAGGDGSAVNPYQIANWNHLNNVRYHLGDHFILMNDLDSYTDSYADIAGTGANAGKGWQPIGANGAPFEGHFDGQRYAIMDLFIDRPAEYLVGLFGLVGTEGILEAVSVLAISVTGSDGVGALVGQSLGTLRDCYASTSVYGNWYVGGLAGANLGAAIECHCTSIVDGNLHVGGLVGWNDGIVTDCCATFGQVFGESAVGGLVGWNDGDVSNCYSTGGVYGDVGVGGLVGASGTSATVSSSFWDTQTSGTSVSDDGTGASTAEMLRLETFSGWDITGVTPGDINLASTWNIYDRRSYPFLSWYSARFELKAGWNMVSVPEGLPIGENTPAQVFKGKIVAIYTWDPIGKSYVVPAIIEPETGYWVAVTEDKVITKWL